MQRVDPRAVHPEHPFDLVVDPLPQHHPRPAGIAADRFDQRRGQGLPVGQRHAGGKTLAHRLGQRGIQRDQVGLGHMAARCGQRVSKGAVIGQQYKTGACLVSLPAGKSCRRG